MPAGIELVTESLFQIDEPNTDKDAAAPLPGESVEVWKTLGIRGCCWNDHSFVGLRLAQRVRADGEVQ